jgi:hypothetical protein
LLQTGGVVEDVKHIEESVARPEAVGRVQKMSRLSRVDPSIEEILFVTVNSRNFFVGAL